jgi:predicted small secreted protein
MEQLVVILVFAVCAAVCVSIFVESYLMEHRTLEEKNAILAAVSGAESYRASGNGGTVFYNDQWEPCVEEEASYVLRTARFMHPDTILGTAEITVSRIDGEVLFILPAAAHSSLRGVKRDE